VDEICLRAGGCAINTGTWLAGFGLKVGVAGKVGTDVFGGFLMDVLETRGIDNRMVLRDQTSPTSASVVLVDSSGERTFLHLPGANGTLTDKELDEELLLGCRALHIGGSLLMPALDGPPLARILEVAQGRGVSTSLDAIWDPTGSWSRVESCLPYLDRFFANLGEARAITGLDDPVAAAEWVRARGVKEVALKLGRRGSYVLGDDYGDYVGPLTVKVIDETGAGDAYVGGYLFARLAGWPFEQAARFANAAGAFATTTVGASEVTASAHQLLELASEFRP
jgi:sugar/nucleoside kinase (ribokinase family)